MALRASGMSYREIAEALDVSATSIGTMLARAEDAVSRRLEATEGSTAPTGKERTCG